MTYEEAKQKAIARMTEDNASIASLKEAAIRLNNDLTASDNAFSLTLDCLEARLNETEFVIFLETLE